MSNNSGNKNKKKTTNNKTTKSNVKNSNTKKKNNTNSKNNKKTYKKSTKTNQVQKIEKKDIISKIENIDEDIKPENVDKTLKIDIIETPKKQPIKKEKKVVKIDINDNKKIVKKKNDENKKLNKETDNNEKTIKIDIEQVSKKINKKTTQKKETHNKVEKNNDEKTIKIDVESILSREKKYADTYDKNKEVRQHVNSIYKKNSTKVKKINIKRVKIFLLLLFIFVIILLVNNKIKHKKDIKKVDKPVVEIKKEEKKSIVDVLGENKNLSDYPLNLYTLDGSNDVTHPKVISFKNKWNGYKYWIAYTPYLHGDQAKENPFVLASNDLINWETVKGFKNPLDEPEDKDFRKVYNSDTHLVYNYDNDILECYWRYVNDKEDKVIIYKRTTKNGVDWTEKEVVLQDKRTKRDYLSPAIIYENGKYMMWYVDRDFTVCYREYDVSKDEWSEPEKIDIEYDEKVKSWHIDVIKTKKGYEAVLVSFDNFRRRSKMKLYYTYSKDNKEWTIAKPIIDKPENGGIYRSSLLYEDGNYYLFYSVITKEFDRYVSIAYGTDMTLLNGLKKDDVDKFIDYIKKSN